MSSSLLKLPRRADARRSYQALLAAATEVFAAQGPDAPLDEVARRAGTGNATLYRHFPTRRDLLAAVCVGEVEALRARADSLIQSADAAEALMQWVEAFVEHISAQKGLAEALLKGRSEDSVVIEACTSAVAEQAGQLLSRAQRAKKVRADLRVEDLLGVANAIALVAGTDGLDAAVRLQRLFFVGANTPNRDERGLEPLS